MRVPASIAALPLLAGTAAGLLLAGGLPDAVPVLATAGALLALLAGTAALVDNRAGECTAAVVAGCALCGLALGADAAVRTYQPPLLKWHEGRSAALPSVFQGVLREDAAVTPFGTSLVMEVHRVNVDDRGPASRPLGGIRFTVAGVLAADRVDEWRAGRTLRVTATTRRPAVYYNPGVVDDRRALARRGVVLLGSVKSAGLVEVVRRGSWVDETAAEVRAWVRRQLAAAVGGWDPRSGGIAAAILIGDRTGLPEADERRLQEAGTYHVVAISGGNIAIMTLLLLGLLRLVCISGRPAAAATILMLAFYGAVVVPSASVGRAIAAAIVYLAGRLFDHGAPPLNVLAVAAVAATAVAPVTVFDPAFLLSFGATLGILLGVPRVGAVIRAPPRPLAPFVAVLGGTIAAEVALLPIGATLFSRVTFAGLILNFAAIPLMTCVQVGSLLVLALSGVDAGVARLAGRGVHFAADALVESARLVELAPWLTVRASPPSWWAALAYYAAVIAGLARPRYPRGAAALAGLIAVAMIVGTPTARHRVAQPAGGWLRVVFLDVGQADATLLILPDRRGILVDAGGLPFAPPQDGQAAGGYDIGARVVAPAVRALGLRRLDTVVLTHGDPDHVGGALSILRQFRPRAVWEGVPVPSHETLRSLARAAADAGAEWRTVRSGNVLRVNGVELRVLHPPPPEWERQRVRNEDSIVLDIRYGGVSIVLPGDIGAEGERAIAPAYERAPLTLLKAPHHGSATSSTPEFLALLRPDAVVFSAGRGNRFGHPAPAVVARYRALGSQIFSTAEDGAVIVDTDGTRAEVRTWRGRRAALPE